MKRRILMGLLLDGKTGRAFHGRSLHVVKDEPLGLPKVERDWSQVVAGVCVSVVLAALIVSTILAIGHQ